MGFPFDTPTWEGVSGPIFNGFGGSMPGLFSVLAIALAIACLVLGQMKESKAYSKFEK